MAGLTIDLSAHEATGLANANAATPAGQLPADLVLQSERQGDSINVSGSWWEWDTVTGDWFGVRNILLDQGVDFFGGFTTEAWGNTTGGIGIGAVSTSLFDFGVEIDLEKLVGWEGATLYNSWFSPQGRDVSEFYTGNLFTVSNAAAFNSLYLFELWFQQTFLEETISIRLGQLAADEEFAGSDYGSLFINATFGWPPFLSENIPNVGPAFPKGTLGIRLALNPTDGLTFQTAVYQGNPFSDDVNRHGFRWELSSEQGFLWMNEAQVRWNVTKESTGLPGQFKAGFWYQTADFASADTDSATTYQGNYGFYGVFDQLLYREPGEVVEFSAIAGRGGKSIANKPIAVVEKSDQGLGWFGRMGFGPQDRNFIGFYFDTGLTYKGLIPTRDQDTLGIGFAYGQLTRSAAQLLTDEGSHGVGAEMALEVTYQCQLTPWLTIQPDLQFIISPGATRDFNNALVVGVRASVVF
jgi:porin